MSTLPATIADFQGQFVREFNYGTNKDTVMDSDITRAMNDANVIFNTGLWSDTSEAKIAFLYASAHFLVLNVKSAGGLSNVNMSLGLNARGNGGVLNSKTVGSVSINYTLPESLANNPILFAFMQTDFGIRYLQMLTPRLVAICTVIAGEDDTTTELS